MQRNEDPNKFQFIRPPTALNPISLNPLNHILLGAAQCDGAPSVHDCPRKKPTGPDRIGLAGLRACGSAQFRVWALRVSIRFRSSGGFMSKGL